MKKQMFRNNTKNIQYPGGLAVRPGEARMIDECFCPQDKPEVFKVEDILGLSVPKAIKEIPNLSESQLVLVIVAEEAMDKPRKGILDAFGDKLDLIQAEKATEMVVEHLETLEDSDLQEMLLDDEYSEDDKSQMQSVLDDRISEEVNKTEDETDSSDD